MALSKKDTKREKKLKARELKLKKKTRELSAKVFKAELESKQAREKYAAQIKKEGTRDVIKDREPGTTTRRRRTLARLAQAGIGVPLSMAGSGTLLGAQGLGAQLKGSAGLVAGTNIMDPVLENRYSTGEMEGDFLRRKEFPGSTAKDPKATIFEPRMLKWKLKQRKVKSVKGKQKRKIKERKDIREQLDRYDKARFKIMDREYLE